VLVRAAFAFLRSCLSCTCSAAGAGAGPRSCFRLFVFAVLGGGGGGGPFGGGGRRVGGGWDIAVAIAISLI